MAFGRGFRNAVNNLVDRKSLDDVIEYNEDDVRATKHLKDWLAAL